MSARVLAAATPVLKAMDSGSSAYQIAYTAIETSDAVMFGEAAIAKAEVSVWRFLDANYPCTHDSDCNGNEDEASEIVRAVVAALREGA